MFSITGGELCGRSKLELVYISRKFQFEAPTEFSGSDCEHSCLHSATVKNPTMMAHADMPSTVEYSGIFPTQRLHTPLLLPLRSGVSVDWAGLALHHHNTLSIGRLPCIVINR